MKVIKEVMVYGNCSDILTRFNLGPEQYNFSSALVNFEVVQPGFWSFEAFVILILPQGTNAWIDNVFAFTSGHRYLGDLVKGGVGLCQHISVLLTEVANMSFP